MIVPTKTAIAAAGVACIVASAVAACAAPPMHEQSAAASAPLRVMVQLVRASEDGAAIGAEATRIAGVPVTHAAATSTTWHALALHCATSADCDAAVARLRAAAATYRAVEIEGRKSPAAS